MVEIPTEIKHPVEECIRTLFDLDDVLFAIDANERSITHKLGEYLTPFFRGWHVDCEYNRKNHNHQKIIDHLELMRRMIAHGGKPPKKKPRKRKDTSVYPDVIVHRRMIPDNLLSIETKKSTSKVPKEYDYAKLELFTANLAGNENNLHYAFGVFVLFRAGGEVPQSGSLQADLVWFINGAKVEAKNNEPITAKYDPTKWLKPL